MVCNYVSGIWASKLDLWMFHSVNNRAEIGKLRGKMHRGRNLCSNLDSWNLIPIWTTLVGATNVDLAVEIYHFSALSSTHLSPTQPTNFTLQTLPVLSNL